MAENGVKCRYCGTVDCTNTYFGETVTQHDTWLIASAQQIYDTCFANRNVRYVDLSEFFQFAIVPPQTTPQVAHLCLPYVLYTGLLLQRSYNQMTLVPQELLHATFCRLLVFKAALHFSTHMPQLANYARPQHGGPNSTLIDDFFVAFTDLVVQCFDAHLQPQEKCLMFAMLVLHHDSEEWIKDRLGLLPALEHYEFEQYCTNYQRFNVDKVKEILKGVKRVARVFGPLTLLSPLHSNPDLSPADVLVLHDILYAH